jgi:hypothetical protein
LVSSFVLCGATTIVLCGATTLVLCGTTAIALCGTHHALWLSFRLIGWFGLWLGFGLSSGDIFGLWLGFGLSSGEIIGLWQDCEAIILGGAVSQSISVTPLVSL